MNTEFQINERMVKDILVIELAEELDALVAPKIKEIIGGYIASDIFKIVINFKKVTHINSLAMGILRGKLRDVREKGGDIKLAEMNEHITELFEMIGLDELFEIFDSEKKAIRAFK